MSFAEIVLSLGIAVLACGSLALFVVRLTSPNLQGIGCLSGSFAAGSVSAALLIAFNKPVICVMCADLGLLLSFVLLHVAVLKLASNAPVPFWHAGLLLGLQMLVDMFRIMGLLGSRPQVVTISVLVAIQTATTAFVLWKFSRSQVRAPATFSAVLLASFAAFNLIRAGVRIFDPQNKPLNHILANAAFCMYIAVALGLAFGFFWMTTAVLTRELEDMASTDPLTRLYNRRVFLKWCEKEMLRTQRTHVPFSLLMLDLDHFKRINDDFGHQAGDDALCAAVEKMQDSVRGLDVLCRWGGEEFAVLLPNAAPEATRMVAERIRENIGTIVIPGGRAAAEGTQPVELTVSIGAATYRDFDDGLAAMLQRADRALYAAKAAGRNCVLLAS
ncbi:MAG: GGDEF domain-containing protein [Janthinobacterium lividum]